MDEMKELVSPNTDDLVVTWVSSEWLEDHLDNNPPVIVDCRQQTHAYFHEHIPGAIHLHEALLRMHIGRHPVQWISPASAEILFSLLGVEQDCPVVVYSETKPRSTSSAITSDGLEQSLVAYSLARFGCRKVLILDGGFSKWKGEDRPLTQDPGISRPSSFTVDMQIGFLAGYAACLSLKGNPETMLLDTRPASWYEGQGPWMKPGHIPGAVNLPATLLMDDKNTTLLKPEEEIRNILFACGATPEKTIICSCGTGRTATLVFLILKFYLGYPDVLMYEGGFTEWSSYPDNPVVTGKNLW
jgi:thiosulfate/3-mercaptopyruvate sulfurtransferase